MGFVLSVLYFGIAYLTPEFLLGPMATWHIQQLLVALVFIVSIPALLRSFVFKSPQSLAIIGLSLAVFLSEAISNHYIGGGIQAFESFIPNGIAFFFVAIHCTTKRRLQVIVATIFLVCVIVIGNGYRDLLLDVPDSAPPPGVGVGNPVEHGATASPYLYRQMNNSGQWIFRLKGRGQISDPNDFAQLIVCLLPMIFAFQRPKSSLANFLFVFVPTGILLFGLYLTHSRGGLLALSAILVVAGRRRIGTVPAMALAGCLFLGAMAMQFTGGRNISADAGEDRTSLWGEGLAALKTHPVFGVGFENLGDYTDSHLTAHNSVVVCAAELGVFGLYFWSMFLLPTLRDAKNIASPELVTEAVPITRDVGPYWRPERQLKEMSKEEIDRLGQSIFLSLVGFLVAGWFLSRAFVLTLFLLGGMAESIYQMALERGMIGPRMPFIKVSGYSAGFAFFLLVLVYVVVRILNFAH